MSDPAVDDGLGRVRIVLVETQHPGNIGSAARAMANMGLSDLWLVNPLDHPHKQARMMAAEARDLLAAAHLADDLDTALADCHLAIATSRRERTLDWPSLDIDETVETIAASPGRVALVFGPEPSGLSNADLYRCQYRSHLPTAEDCPSLNLAQAVQIYSYAIRRRMVSEPRPAEHLDRASRAASEGLVAHLRQLVELAEYPTPDADQLEVELRAIVNRVGLGDRQVRLLRGVLRWIEGRIRSGGG